MKILSLNYPMQEEDNKKLDLLTSNYKQNQFKLVENEMIEFVVPPLDLSV
jgi:hypothetical protein